MMTGEPIEIECRRERAKRAMMDAAAQEGRRLADLLASVGPGDAFRKAFAEAAGRVIDLGAYIDEFGETPEEYEHRILHGDPTSRAPRGILRA